MEMLTAADVDVAKLVSPLYTAVMLSVCGVTVVVLFIPLQPAIPTATQANKSKPA